MAGEQILTNRPLPGARLNMAHPLAKGLVGCWLLNEQGNKANDLSPYQNHGTLVGFASPTQRPFNGLPLNGVNQYIQGVTNSRYIFGNNKHSYIVWASLAVEPIASNYLIATGNGNTGEQSGFAIGVGSTLMCSGYTSPLVTTTYTVNKVTDIHQYGLAYNKTKALFYDNGRMVESKAIALNSTIGNLIIGGNAAAGTPIKGKIYMVLVYNRQLLADEFQANFISPYAPFSTEMFI